MTVNEYLWRLEWYKCEKERAYERYMRLSERTISPRSSLNFDGMPRNTGSNTRELQLVKASAALEKYYKAADRYESYRDEILANLSQIDYSYRIALEYVYVWNLDKEVTCRNTGLCRVIDIRKKDLPFHIKAAKAQLRHVLIDQGIDVE